MFKRQLLLALVGLICALLVVPAAAQTPPPQVNAALNDLSTRLGLATPLTIGDMDRWEWRQDVATDSSLGCFKAGEVYTQGRYVYYQFSLTYSGVTYDYRVSEDQTIIRLCNEDALQAIPAECLAAGYAEPRLRIGARGRVEAGGVPNNIRDIPGQSGQLVGEIPPDAEFIVIAGPSCAFNFVWWRVDYNGIQGWTVESSAGDYWLEPIDLPVSEQARTLIEPSNVSSLTDVPLTGGDVGVLHGWSPDSDTLAAVATGNAMGVWLYDLTAEGAPRRLLQTTSPVTSIAFNADGSRIALGQENGQVTLWSVDTNTVQATLQGTADVAVTALAFNEGATLLAVGDANGVVRVWEVSLGLERIILQAHTAAVGSLSFSPDGTFLTSSGEDGSLRVWSVSAVG